MSDYTASVSWVRSGAQFTDSRYSRVHEWAFDGGVVVAASASPHVVPVPFSDPAAVDPEEAFVAALSSCHMLTFLWLAAKGGFVVDSYRDEPVGEMRRNAEGRQAITRVTLHPRIEFSGSAPSPAQLHDLHEAAHRECYLANSVRTEVVVQPNP